MLDKEIAKKQARKLVAEFDARAGGLKYQDALDIVARLNDIRDWKTFSGLADKAAHEAESPEAEAGQSTIPGEGVLYRVPVSVDTSMTAYVLARGQSVEEAIETACRFAFEGNVAFEVDEGNYRGLVDHYCPDPDSVEPFDD